MQKSMTGFGKAEVTVGAKRIVAEIRSLNSKQLDMSLRMPATYRAAEGEVRSLVQRMLVRGKVEVFITTESNRTEGAAQIDKQLFRTYMKEVGEALAMSGADCSYDAMLPVVMRMPNVVATANEEATSEEQEALLQAVEMAATRLDDFRKQEGATLIDDLLRRVELIESLRNDIIPFEEQRADTVRTRIREGIEKLGIEVDNNRLEQEMIFYIEKLDITEEKVRLENHCRYFREVATSEEAAGRKLGFIAQEMGREINTTGSKANHHEIQKLVVKMKDELEKIKEQVLNIL